MIILIPVTMLCYIVLNSELLVLDLTGADALKQISHLSVSVSQRNSSLSRWGQFLAMASIMWSTWILTFIRSDVPITMILAAFSFGTIEFHSWSVMWTMPERARPEEGSKKLVT